MRTNIALAHSRSSLCNLRATILLFLSELVDCPGLFCRRTCTSTMAEAVGLMASIIAVAGLADKVIHFVHITKKYARDLKTVRSDLTHSVEGVGFLAATMHTAQKTLDDYCKRQTAADRSALIDLLDSQDASKYLRRESSLMRKQLGQLKSEITSLLETRWTIWVTWKWRHSLKKDIEDFRVQMHFMQTNLSVILECVRLEMALRRKDRDLIEM